MSIQALFFDVGGVLLTNGWDRLDRRQAVDHFGLDWDEFEDRHELVVPAFERGQLSLEEYLDRTVFYRVRNFSRQDFENFMYGRSEPLAESLALLDRLARSRNYFLATLNNESRELNAHRIERFRLREYFSVFFSSCYLGVKKPDRSIYMMALQLTQRPPQECVFIDDRELNLECARSLGLNCLLFETASHLQHDLAQLGVVAS